jgi:hypothetical protein
MKARAALLPWGFVLFLPGCSSGVRPDDRSDDYLLAVDTPVGIGARRDVLEAPSPVDGNRVQQTALRILLRQDDEDGSWAHDATATGRALVDLHVLDILPEDDPAVRRAADFLLGRDVDYRSYEVDSPAWGKDWIALYALNLWAYGEEPRVRETVHALLDHMAQWLDGGDGRLASALLRAVTLHPLLKERENRELLVENLKRKQLPSGVWDLGPGTSELTVLAALLPLAEDVRIAVQINRYLPALMRGDYREREQDPILEPDEAHLVVVQALKLAGKLESYRRGESIADELAPLELGLYLLAAAGEPGHTLAFEDRPVVISPVPLLMGTEVSRWRPILSPEEGEPPLVRLLLDDEVRQKLDSLIAEDPEVEVALLLRGQVIAVRPLAALRDAEGLVVKGLAREAAAGLVRAVSGIDGGIPAPSGGEE